MMVAPIYPFKGWDGGLNIPGRDKGLWGMGPELSLGGHRGHSRSRV